MRTLRFFAFLFFFAVSPFWLFGQKITANGCNGATASCAGPFNTPVNFSVNLAGGISGIGADLYPVSDTNIWYKSFWIFSDGNYMVSKAEKPATTINQSYLFEKPGSNWVRSYITEYYTNLDPPELLTMPYTTTSSSSSAGTNPPATLLPEGETGNLNIAYHQSPKPNYPVVFVLSFLEPDAGGGAIEDDAKDRKAKIVDIPNGAPGLFFFYNHKEGSAAINAYEKTEHVLPAYFQSAGIIEQATSRFDDALFTNMGLLANFKSSMNDKFENYFYYPFNAMDSGTPLRDGFNRKRIFPVMKTKNDRELIEKNVVTLAIMVGLTPTTLSDAEKSLITKYLGISVDTPLVGSNLYITGIAESYSEVVSEHDPNKLEIIKVCETDAGKVVTFRMTMCNVGKSASVSQIIQLTDLTDGHVLNLQLEERPGEVERGGNPWEIHTGITINGIQPGPEAQDNCRSIEFSVLAPNDFSSDQPILEACVTFRAAAVECPREDCCSQNEPIPGNFKVPYNCGNGECDWTACICAIVAFLVALVLLFWKKLFKRNQQTPNS